MKNADKILSWAAELQSLAQAGLFYGKDKYRNFRRNVDDENRFIF